LLFYLALEALEEHERSIIERLYDDHSKRVRELAILMMNNDSNADDIVNDTFLKVIRYKEKFLDASEKEQIRLLIICTRSICINIYNRNKKIKFISLNSMLRDEDDEEVQIDVPDDIDILKTIVQDETSRHLQTAIEKLAHPARDIVILKYYFEMKNTEIAEFYNMNVSTVSTVLHRSMKILRRELEGYINGTNK